MSNRHLTLVIFLLVASQLVLCTNYYVKLYNNGPVTLGADITFTTEVFDFKGNHPAGPFRFVWMDDAIPKHDAMIEQDSAISNWTVHYDSDLYGPGEYEVEVIVKRWSFITWRDITSGRAYFNITMLLNGGMGMYQNNSLIASEYMSSKIPVRHEIDLQKPDREHLEKNATSVLTYWFIDCEYYGFTTNYTFTKLYNTSNDAYNVEALVVASYEPIPPPTTPAPPTTTTSTTTPKPTTTVPPTKTPSTTTPKPKSVSSTVVPSSTAAAIQQPSSPAVQAKSLVKRSILSAWERRAYTSDGFFKGSLQVPFTCLNQTVVPMDSNKTYGYFQRKIYVQDPVSNVTIVGNNWLQHGDMLMLQVKCRGTPPFEYCIMYEQGQVNITGNETCPHKALHIQNCEFPVLRYFPTSDIMTSIIIISNSVQKVVSPVTVRFYKVVTKAQLSVIVVPVSFSIIAAILIVFGVAYYIQNRSRFTVEVANFNFGRQYADMEYKTFGERLRESFNNALNWGGTENNESPSPPWPVSDNNKYGTMT